MINLKSTWSIELVFFSLFCVIVYLNKFFKVSIVSSSSDEDYVTKSTKNLDFKYSKLVENRKSCKNFIFKQLSP
jgi:hypothetical protein